MKGLQWLAIFLWGSQPWEFCFGSIYILLLTTSRRHSRKDHRHNGVWKHETEDKSANNVDACGVSVCYHVDSLALRSLLLSSIPQTMKIESAVLLHARSFHTHIKLHQCTELNSVFNRNNEVYSTAKYEWTLGIQIFRLLWIPRSTEVTNLWSIYINSEESNKSKTFSNTLVDIAARWVPEKWLSNTVSWHS